MKKVIIITGIFIVLVFTSVNAYAEDTQTGVLLEVVADTDQVLRTQMVNLTLKASDIDDLYTMQMEIRYDPKKLELDQASIKNLVWEINQSGYSAIQIDSKIGAVNIIYSKKGKIPGVSGNNNLLGLQFKTLRIGKATVEVSNVKLINSHANVIKATTAPITKEINILPNPLGITLTGVKGKNDWYISDVMVEIYDLDANEIYYTVDGIRYDYAQPFTINEIGQHNLKVTTNDGYGYIKEKEAFLKIDYNCSTITLDNQYPEWQNEDLKIMPKYDDENGSGILKFWYQWTNTIQQPTEWIEYNQEELIQTTEGLWYLHAKAVDLAGNTTQTVFGPYGIDKTVPVISVDYNKRENWENTDIFVTPVFTDDGGSQIKYMGYRWSLDQSTPSEYTTYASDSLLQSNDGAWYLHLIVEDVAGNTKTESYGPYKIDKSAPTIEFSGITEGMDYTDTVTPIITIADTVSGIKTQTSLLDGQTYESGTPVTVQGTHTITAFAEDFGGNITKKSISFKVYASTAITLDVPQVEYSDTYTINAKLTSYNQTVSGAAITIRINGADIGTACTDSQGNAILNGIALYSAGTYIVDAIYLQDDSAYFRAAQSQSSLTVITEKNSLIYTGSIEAQYPEL